MKFDGFKTFSATLLTSSSLLVVVLGFAFQTSLEDFIAGILISIFKPFNIDDRITLTELNISGYVENITIRHTVIRTFSNNRLIIPNSKMNKSIIENTHMITSQSLGFLDLIITYDSNLELAKKIMTKSIIENQYVIDTRTQEEKQKKSNESLIYIRELNLNGISLRGNVTTSNIDKNFLACSQIRETILKSFKENNIFFSSTQISGSFEIKKED